MNNKPQPPGFHPAGRLHPQLRLKAARYGWLLALDSWDATVLYDAQQRYMKAVRVAERELAALVRAREYGYWISQGVANG